MDEQQYRQRLADTFKHIAHAFDEVDPDLVELTHTGDTLQLAFADGSKAILSPQPPKRQIWLAARSEGLHYDYHEGRRIWMTADGYELYPFLADLVLEEAGVLISL